MKRRIAIFTVTLLLAAAAFVSCTSNDSLSDLPPKIASFVSQYFPNSDIESYTHTGNIYHVRIKNGVGMTFGEDQEWEAVNGYGERLPQVLMFDQLPPALYAYLQETENTGEVFALERDDGFYTVTVLNTTITYDSKTDTIKEI